jgi:molecular chaperone HtpG
MKIIETLRNRIQTPKDQNVGIESQLHTLAIDIEKKCREHLKRVITVLKEFDLHDEAHSSKVLENIEELLGDNIINDLSSYELFLLHLAPFLHDCAMAPAEWEIKLFELTEGTSEFYTDEQSIKHDLKAPLKLSEAVLFIKKNMLYQNFDEVSQWFFSPLEENKLIEELAELLLSYQSFRNGHKEKIKKLKSVEEFELLNESIRIGFIRENHHLRVEKYIKNLSKIFETTIEQSAWGKQLARDLAAICRSHCEDVPFIERLSSRSHYFGKETANLQMVAILLRLGDIIHFSFDRAPIEIRASKVFKSSYSFHEWAVKNNGVNYTIENGLISFKAFCETPKDYFKIHEYIDWIDIEIQNYFRFERKWKKNYLPELKEKVNRDGVRHDEDVFFPIRDLKFKLNQKQILELLMGVGLYKDKYSCLRELYQNALDACRCLKSSSSNPINNSITFGLSECEEGIYLVCQDDGIGMTKDIIQNYLLNIGNSYYKSSEFFKKQAQWDGGFTPTSQFGIGILSCFMIGTRIDITTKASGGDVISCAIDGPHESFYYKAPNKLDIETVGTSGTIVKVLLSPSIEEELIVSEVENLDFLLFRSNVRLNDEFKHYEKNFADWKNHLFNKINQMVSTPTIGVKVKVKLVNGNTLEVGEKPYNYCEFENVKEELPFIDYLVSDSFMRKPDFNYSQVTPKIRSYKLFFEHKGIQVSCLICLPKEGFPFNNVNALTISPIIGQYGICIDGIRISSNVSLDREIEDLSAIERIALLNFTGDIRPQISVDRKAITSWPDKLSGCMSEITKKLINTLLEKVKEHIALYDLLPNSNEVNLIWNYIFSRFDFASSYLIHELVNSDVGDVNWSELNELTDSDITIRDFIEAKELVIQPPNNIKKSKVTEQILIGKLLSADSITLMDNEIIIQGNQKLQLIDISDGYGIRDDELFISSSWDESNQFDLISDLLPVIPTRLFNAFKKGEDGYRGAIRDRAIKISSFGNGVGALFKQDPVMINEFMGIYSKERDSFGNEEKNKIYNFHNRRPSFWLREINSQKSMFEDKEFKVLFVFVSPRALNDEEVEKLSELSEKDPSYVKGVKEGWSILFTGMKEQNSIIKAGLQTRDDMVKELSESFWSEYQEKSFWFVDGTEMKQM